MRYLLSFLISNLSFFMSLYFIQGKSIVLNEKKNYLGYFISWLFVVFNFEFSVPTMRFILNVIIYVMLVKYLFNQKWKDSILLSLITFMLAIISEIIYAMIANGILSGLLFYEDSPILVLINNVGIAIIMLFLSKNKTIRRLYCDIISFTDKINEKQIAIFSLLIVILFNFSYLISYFFYRDILKHFYLTFIGSIVTLFSTLLAFLYFKTNNKYLNVYEKYNISLDSIREFEQVLERYRINSHENKNQLKTIRCMSKERKVVSYIDSLLDEKIDDDQQLIIDTQRIPVGGLRGIIYTKLLTIKQNNIPFELVVDEKVTTDKVRKIDDGTLTSVCQILGVFLDNSIEEVSRLKEQYILVEVYHDGEDLAISVTNNYEGYVDFETINEEGFTTKGDNHGYGLSLVKKLVKKNKKLFHESEIIDNNFVQKIKIKV